MRTRAQQQWFLILGLFVVLLVRLTDARADDLAGGFDSANKLYEEGKYPAAAEAYDKLLASGNVSEALYFNRGNAEFKLGQLGRAIASYRQAQCLAPRDPELRANLRLARTRARGGSTYSSDRWRNWLGDLSLNEWTVLTSLALWLVFILLALGQWRPVLKAKLRNCLLVSSLAVVFLGICLGIMVNDEFFSTSAIVVTGEADVRNGPLEESPAIFKVRDGIELTITDKKDGWLLVTDPAQRKGWLRQDQVIIFEAGRRPGIKS
jgi:tetratricopeptide (TPR) repeat protein